MPPTTFLYHTEAVGASGFISLPVADTMPLQASIASAIGASFGKVRVENFKHLDYLSIGSVESQVVSSFSEKDKAHGTLATVLMENLSTLNVVRCDRFMTRLTSKHDEHCDKDGTKLGTKPGSFILHGTHFDGFRIGGHEIDFRLEVGMFSELSTWESLTGAWKTPAIRKELQDLMLYPTEGEELPTHNGVFACTLAHIPEKLPRGLKRVEGQGIYVPHFGTIYPAHYYLTPTSRRLRMLHIDLGCTVEGCNGYGDSGSNGQGLPGSG
jgi:hypothetical protein